MKIKQIILSSLLFIITFTKVGFAKSEHETDTKEMKFGREVDNVMCSSRTLVFHEALNNKINEIGDKIVKASDRPDMKCTFRVINDTTINAYSTSGGFIYINTGLLDILESEDELASIIAHEVAHVNGNHAIKFLNKERSSMIIGNITGWVLSTALGMLLGNVVQNSDSPVVQGAVAGVAISGIEAQLIEPIVGAMVVSMITGYGKQNEFEADALAVRYAKRAGYDPGASVGFFQKCILIRNRLCVTEKNYVSKLINAEPGLEERMKNIEGLITRPKQ